MSSSIHAYIHSPTVKIVLIGEASVGKTSIINVVQRGEYVPDQPTTIGACFYIKKVMKQGTLIKLHLWDTAGQERFKSVTPMYFRDAQYAIIVYAIDDQSSFDAVGSWHRALKKNCKLMPKVVLVGNKTDMAEKRQVSREMAEEAARNMGASYFEASAKFESPVLNEIFETIAADAFSTAAASADSGKSNSFDVNLEQQAGLKCC